VCNRLIETRHVVVGVRPYAVKRGSTGAAATVIANQWLGDQSHIAASFANGTIVLVEHDRAPVADGEPIAIQIDPSDLHIFDPQTGEALSHGQDIV
jgi:multiple sugar transport system ATP-binding protein